MAKIRNVTLPADLNDKLVPLLDKIPDFVLSDYGKKLLSGGFTHGQSVRERLAAKIRSASALEPWVVGLLHRVAPGGVTVSMLSADGLQQLCDSLAALIGRDQVLLPLLLDPREDVHKVGADMLARGAAQPPAADKKAACHTLFQFVDKHLLSAAGICVTPDPEEEKERSQTNAPLDAAEVGELIVLTKRLTEAVNVQKGVIEQLQRNLQEQGRKHKTKLELAARHASDEKKRLVAEREQFRIKLLRLAKEKDALAKQHEQLTAEQQAVITQGIEQQTSTLVRKWLAGPVQTEQHLEQLNLASGDLLARAEQVLQAQARQDRFTGNRLELERQLAQLRETRDRLTRAAQTALSPITPLREVLDEIEEKIAHTEKILAGPRSGDPLTERLLMAINKAATWDEAHHYSELLDELAESDLTRKEDRRRLYDAVQRKFSLLEESHRLRDTEAPDQGWSLRDAIFRNRPSLLILDGHNLLFGLDDIFRPDYDENGRPGRKAREHLVKLVRKLVDGRANLRARICFDAPQHEIVTIAPNIEIEFSGGQGAHRADQRIGEHVTWRRPEELEQKWFVVTDDRAVRREAVKNGARFVPADLFAVLLSDFQCLTESPKVAA